MAEFTVPPKIAAIIERLHTQDNRITANPLFAVQQKRTIGGLGAEYADQFAWICDGSEVDSEEAAKLDALRAAGEPIPADCRRVGFIEKWEFVTGCLTEQGCKDFIACNGHNLKEPRIYAYSGYRNAEFIAVREWLMSLRAPGVMACGAAQPLPGLQTLQNVVECLRADARYVDEEGEATNRLQDLLDALRASGVPACETKQEKNMELPDAIRVPLDELEADAAYIIGRVAADGSCSGIMVETIRRRTRAVREALLAHGVDVPAGVEHLVPVHPNDGADWDSLFRGTVAPWPLENGYAWRRVVIFDAPGVHAISAESIAQADAEEAAAGVGAGGAPGDGAGVEFCPRSGEHVMGCAEWCATPTGACRACGALAMTAPPFGGRKTRADDEAFQQHQRDRIAEAQRHDAEQAKPKLTDGVARTGDDTEGRSK